MGIRVFCPNGHRLHLKSFLAGKRGVCPHCQAKFDIPSTSDPAAEAAARHQRGQRAAGTQGAQASPEPGDVELVVVRTAAAEPPPLPQGGEPGPGVGSAVPAERTAARTRPGHRSHELSQGHAPSQRHEPQRHEPQGHEPQGREHPQARELPQPQGPRPAQTTARSQPDVGPAHVLPLGGAGHDSASPAAGDASLPPHVAIGVPSTAGTPAASDSGVTVAGRAAAQSTATPLPANVPGPTVDPLDLDPQAVWYIHVPTVGQFGPANAAQVRDWLSEGRFGPGALMWRDGWSAWKLAGDVLPAAAFRYEAGVAGPGIVPSVSAGEKRGARRTGTAVRRDRAAWVLVLFALIALAIALLVLLFTILSGAGTQEPSAAHGPTPWVVAARMSTAARRRADGTVELLNFSSGCRD